MYDGPAELYGHILDLDLYEVVIERCQVDALHLLMTGYEHDLFFEAAVAALGDLRIAGLALVACNAEAAVRHRLLSQPDFHAMTDELATVVSEAASARFTATILPTLAKACGLQLASTDDLEETARGTSAHKRLVRHRLEEAVQVEIARRVERCHELDCWIVRGEVSQLVMPELGRLPAWRPLPDPTPASA